MLWLQACTEYLLAPEPTPPAPGELVVVPEAVALEGVCEAESTTIVLQNHGGTALSLTGVTLEGAGWSVQHAALPAPIPAGKALNIDVTGSAGQATLRLDTDDPARPSVSVPLSATANRPPTVYITAPFEGQVLDPAAPFTLAAVVSDPESAPDTLLGEWRSNRVGTLGTGVPDADGRLRSAWPEALRVPGPVVVELVLTDPCGAVGEASMYACQDGAWAVSSLAEDVWLTEGDAAVDPLAGSATLGPGAGAAYDAYLTFDADRFAADFELKGGGAGVALVLLDAARHSAWLGAEGCGLGLGAPDCAGSGLPGWAVVLDTLAGDGNDCAEVPSVSLVVDGVLDPARPCAPLPAPFAGGRVQVLAEDGRVQVALDGASVLDVALPEGASGAAYAGFTGVGDWAVDTLTFTDSRCDPV